MPLVRLAELVAALSLGIDLGFGQPMEHVLRQCLIATRLADRIGLDVDERASVYYTALLVNVGYPRAARINFPEIMKVIDDSGRFESMAVLPGQELGLSHEIFRFNPPASH